MTLISHGQESFVHLCPTKTELAQARYLVTLLMPYFDLTVTLSKTSGVTIHKAWSAYATMFLHLEEAERKLLHKMRQWKLQLANAIVAAH